MAESSNDDPSTAKSTSGRSILVSAIAGAIAAGFILMLFVLPAEYGIDPTGIGAKLGLSQMQSGPTRTLEIADVLGGNEAVTEVEIPDYGEPVPLPNPEVHQLEAGAPQSITLVVPIAAESETEIKTVLRQGKVIVYDWATDQGMIYSDMHGHDPEAGSQFFVRYLEDVEGSSGHSGSLVAPFAGEHGWYWLNYNEFPVTVTLTITGFYDDIKDYSDQF
jgi:hypothetical protein